METIQPHFTIINSIKKIKDNLCLWLAFVLLRSLSLGNKIKIGGTMIPKKPRFFLSLGLSFLMAIGANAQPAEKTYEEFNRNTGNDTQLEYQFELTKNVYKQEPYEAEYSVSIPYEAQETYYVNVPYQVEEPYTDYERYTDSQWTCHNVRRYRRECHKESYCGAPLSTNFEIMTPPPSGGHRPPPIHPPSSGGGGHRPPPGGGGHHPPPPPHRPPGGGGGNHHPPPPPHRPPSCVTRDVCRDVPYNDQQCGYESVVRQRPVTRYRTVTRYRQEERTRTVTRYRNEVRCCVTKYKDVFDHQYGFDVTVQLPRVFLFGAETEKFRIALQGTEESPQFAVIQDNDEIIYGYKISKQEISGRKVTIELDVDPRFDLSNAGPNSISNFSIVTSSGRSYLNFYDEVKVPHLNTKYIYEIKDRNNNTLVKAETWNRGFKAVEILMPQQIPVNEQVTIFLHVHREGAMVKNYDLDFDVNSNLKVK